MTECDEGEELLKDLGFIHISKMFVSYDIECVTINSKDNNEILPQQICSIGCRASWKNSGQMFHRRDSNPSSALILIKEFVNLIDNIHLI